MLKHVKFITEKIMPEVISDMCPLLQTFYFARECLTLSSEASNRIIVALLRWPCAPSITEAWCLHLCHILRLSLASHRSSSTDPRGCHTTFAT